MIEIRPFRAEDMLYVIEHGIKEVGLKSQATKELVKAAEEREKSGTCITGRVNGEIIGVAGIDPIWEGVGEIWMMLTPYVDKNIKEVYKCIREGIKKLIDECKLRRVESYGRVDFPQCHVLFKHLGFKVEGKKEAYTPDGVDCVMYAKVK